MESNNQKNNNYGEGSQHLRRSAQKRKFNELTKDGHDKTAAEEEQKQPESSKNLRIKKRRQQENNDLEFKRLSREDLIKLVKKKGEYQNETQKQLKTTQKEAEESAKQAEELSQRILQLDQEKAELQEDLNKNLAKIVEIHKDMEKKSKDVAEKTEQCNALIIQLNNSRQEQTVLPMNEQMKILLSLEEWFDWLAFVPRYHLGKIVPKIGDRKFASIVQKFLHVYREFALDNIDIVPPYEEHPSDSRPRVRAWQHHRQLRVKMADSPMPANIKNFGLLVLSYFDTSVLEFIRKFQQNCLLDNVTLSIPPLSKDIVQPVLTHLLPLINGILSVELAHNAMVDIYDAGNSKEMSEMNMEMMEKTRFLGANYDVNNLLPIKIDLYCRWLYQTPRKDGKPRMLLFGQTKMDRAPISPILDRIKQDFLTATHPRTFFIRINLPKALFQPEEEHIFILRNEETNEKLVTKMEEAQPPDPDEDEWEEVVLLISRYPLESTQKWIEENKKEILDWDFSKVNCMIALDEELKTIKI